MITPHTAAPESRTRLRRFVSIGLVLVGVVWGRHARGGRSLAAPPVVVGSAGSVRRVEVGLRLHRTRIRPGNGPDDDRHPGVEVARPFCAPDGLSWLATPVVTYTPVSVMIQLRMTDTAAATCADSHLFATYLSGIYLPVHLSEPLGGRALFDGSSSPAAARPYP